MNKNQREIQRKFRILRHAEALKPSRDLGQLSKYLIPVFQAHFRTTRLAASEVSRNSLPILAQPNKISVT
ncbi:MAG: hypothetical protein AAED33_05280 [Paracoccaceae bacterium]